MSNLKCDACGSTDIDVDAARADAVCTNCGNVLESSIIVSDIQFEENAHGGASAIGTFVSSDTKGGGFSAASMGMGRGGGRGGSGPAGGLNIGWGRESRELTLRNATKKIEALANQLSLRRDKINIAVRFFRQALSKGLTRGRKSTHVIAACVYITCRTEGTSHMLIDISDVLQIDVYELGRTYLRLSQALHINIKNAMDPCIYVMRFAHKLELADKTHEVAMTAQRVVSRMKKDWMHFGRRPSGLCGAALLIAARLHGYHRSVYDVIKVVKVHESTLRKRLNEFGETPTSQLSLDEFMSVDLDAMTEEQDPPSYKAARKKDKELLMKLEEEGDLDEEISELEEKIEKELEKIREKVARRYGISSVSSPRDRSQEVSDEEAFIAEQTMSSINEFVGSDSTDKILMPPPRSGTLPVVSPGLGLKDTIQEYLTKSDSERQPDFEEEEDEDGELDLTGIDDDEIDGYIMSKDEVEYKTKMWEKVNAEYLKEKAEKEERERQEAELAAKEGREVKKRTRKSNKDKAKGGGRTTNATAIEAIEKIVQEKKISTKINYDVLRNLTVPSSSAPTSALSTESSSSAGVFGESPIRPPETIRSVFSPASPRKSSDPSPSRSGRKRLSSFNSSRNMSLGSPVKKKPKTEEEPPSLKPKTDSREVVVESGPVVREEDPPDLEEDEDFMEEDEDDRGGMLSKMLSQHRGDEDEEGYLEEEYY